MRKGTFWAAASTSLLIMIVLAAVAMVEPPRYQRATDTLFKRVWRSLSKDELNREAREQQTAAYYEGLLNESSRVSGMNSLITGGDRFEAEDWDQLGRRRRDDFRYWDLQPGFVHRDALNPRADIAVNSHGMADHEYTLRKEPNVWRVALLGDSITRGQGAPMFRNYETILEERLQAEQRPGTPRVEVLNFAVGGYRIAQLVDSALEWAAPFNPDLYVLPLSELSVFRRWADHIVTLVQGHRDLKYPHIRQIVAESGLRPEDPSGVANAKLARFRLRTIEWAVRAIRAQATSQGAEMVVILLPNGTEPEILHEEFAGVPDVLAKVGVPVIDLLDAFESVDDPVQYRVNANNMHPNERGHRFLSERLYEAIARDEKLRRMFTGLPAEPGAVASN